MSLENVIQENTRAVNALAELIKQAMGMMPPTGTAPVTPSAPQPVPKTAPAPAVEPATPAAPAAPATPADFETLRKSLMPRVQKLFAQSREIGASLLKSVGAKNVSGVPDDKLEAFAKAVDEALAGA